MSRLSNEIVRDLNKLASSEGLFILVGIHLPAGGVIRVCNNNEEIIFQEQSYMPLNFELGELVCERGSLPKISLSLDNTSNVISPYIQDFDRYIKKHGLENSRVEADILIINSIDTSMPLLQERFSLEDIEITNQRVSFSLAAINLFSMSYPPRRFYQTYCMFNFKDSRCKYKGVQSTCDKSYMNCRRLGNLLNFGGFLGLGTGLLHQ